VDSIGTYFFGNLQLRLKGRLPSGSPEVRPRFLFQPRKVVVEDISGTDRPSKRESRVRRIQSPYQRSHST
jgi:hypothetical protein